MADTAPTTAPVTALVERTERRPSAVTLNEAETIADWAYKSRVYGNVKSMAEGVMRIIAGRELGFGPAASLSSIHVYEGKVDVGAHLRAAMIQLSDKYDIEIIQMDRVACEIEFYERSLLSGGLTRKLTAGWVKKPVNMKVTFDEVCLSGQAWSRKVDKEGRPILKDNWDIFRDDMLFASCINKVYRRYCPSLSAGVTFYDPDQLEQIEQEATRPRAFAQLGEEMLQAQAVARVIDKVEPLAPNPPAPAQSNGQQSTALEMTGEQIQELEYLIRSINLNPDSLERQLVTKYSTTNWRAMNAAQAVELISGLKKLLRRHQEPGEPAPAPSPPLMSDPQPVAAPEPVPAPSAPAPVPEMTEAQKSTLTGLIAAVRIAPGRLAESCMAKFGEGDWQKLGIGQAHELIVGLNKMLANADAQRKALAATEAPAPAGSRA